MTGVADATLDRAPLVAITGQVGTDRMHIESHQYLDLVAMFSAGNQMECSDRQAQYYP